MAIKSQAFLFLFFCILSISCKKEEPPKQNASTVWPESPHTVSTATAFTGIFVSTSYTVSGPTSFTGAYTDAYFTDSTANWFNKEIAAEVGSVVLNGKALTLHDRVYYADPPSHLKDEVWQVHGNDHIPTFKYTNGNNEPTCSSFQDLPDSISISQGFTINILGVTNTTELSAAFWFQGAANSSYAQVVKVLVNGDNLVAFTPQDLSVLKPADNGGQVSISIANYQLLNFYGYDFRFQKARWHTKKIKIKP